MKTTTKLTAEELAAARNFVMRYLRVNKTINSKRAHKAATNAALNVLLKERKVNFNKKTGYFTAK